MDCPPTILIIFKSTTIVDQTLWDIHECQLGVTTQSHCSAVWKNLQQNFLKAFEWLKRSIISVFLPFKKNLKHGCQITLIF